MHDSRKSGIQWVDETVDEVVAGNDELAAEAEVVGTMLLLEEVVAVVVAGVVRAARIERSDKLRRCVTGGTRVRVAGKRAVSLLMSLNSSSSCARTGIIGDIKS